MIALALSIAAATAPKPVEIPSSGWSGPPIAAPTVPLIVNGSPLVDVADWQAFVGVTELPTYTLTPAQRDRIRKAARDWLREHAREARK